MTAGMSLSDTYNKVVPMVTEGLQKKALLMGADLLDGIGISGVREAVEIGRLVRLLQTECNLHLRVWIEGHFSIHLK